MQADFESCRYMQKQNGFMHFNLVQFNNSINFYLDPKGLFKILLFNEVND